MRVIVEREGRVVSNTEGESLTHQSFLEETIVQNLILRHVNTGTPLVPFSEAQAGVFDPSIDAHRAMNMVRNSAKSDLEAHSSNVEPNNVPSHVETQSQPEAQITADV